MSQRPTESELDALYGGPFADFVARRNELTKELKAAGEAEAAAAVRGLAKPALSAWAVNRLRLEHGAALDELLATGDGVRAAQGAGDAGSLRDATEERKAAVSRLLELALGEIETQGSPASPAIASRVRSTLEALAAWGTANTPDPPPGRLDGDVEPPGFEVLLGMLPKPSGPRRVASGDAKSAVKRGGGSSKGSSSEPSSPTPRKADGQKPRATAVRPTPAQRTSARKAVATARKKVEAAAAARARVAREEGGLRGQAERIARTVRLAEERLERERAKLEEVEGELARAKTAIERARFGEAEARAELERAEAALRDLG